MSVIALSTASGRSAGQASVQRARLDLFQAEATGGGGASRGASLGSIDFQFNPQKLTITKASEWRSEPAPQAKQTPASEFRGAKPCTLALEMFFDATATMGSEVVTSVEKLLACCVPVGSTSVPPLVVLHWGETHSFTAYVTSVTATYTLFTSGGTPIRATCSVAMSEMSERLGGQNPTSGALDVVRSCRTVDGETLATIAQREYGDPSAWRLLADANGIDDPLRLAAGTPLLVPARARR